jgi:hypothetical protein
MSNWPSGGLEMFSRRTIRSPRKFVAIGAALVALAVVAPASALPIITSDLADASTYDVDLGQLGIDGGLYEQKDSPRVLPSHRPAPELRDALCGSFRGVIVYSSGAAYDCALGTYRPPARQS